jgi:hypothetical protein
LRLFENRGLRRIFGSRRYEVAGGWRILHDEITEGWRALHDEVTGGWRTLHEVTGG